MIVGQTLSPGGIVTVSGTAISYVAAWAVVVVGTSTEAVRIRGLVMSGFVGGWGVVRVVRGRSGLRTMLGRVRGGNGRGWFWGLRWGDGNLWNRIWE